MLGGRYRRAPETFSRTSYGEFANGHMRIKAFPFSALVHEFNSRCILEYLPFDRNRDHVPGFDSRNNFDLLSRQVAHLYFLLFKNVALNEKDFVYPVGILQRVLRNGHARIEFSGWYACFHEEAGL